jgi:hypothetical protein
MRLLICVVLFLLLGILHAEAANLNQGNWTVGGGMYFNSSLDPALPNRAGYFLSSANAQYFFLDGVSAGLAGSFTTSGGRSGRGSLSPILSYYFYRNEKIAHYVSLEPMRWVKWEGIPSRWGSAISLGTKIFLNDYIAVGPEIQYERIWDNPVSSGKSNLSFIGGFSIHL